MKKSDPEVIVGGIGMEAQDAVRIGKGIEIGLRHAFRLYNLGSKSVRLRKNI